MFTKKYWVLAISILLGLLVTGISFLPTSRIPLTAAASSNAPTLRLPWMSNTHGISGNSYGCGDHVNNSGTKYMDFYAIDFGLSDGSPLAATADGFIHYGFDGYTTSYGHYMYIAHTNTDRTLNGYVSLYAHMGHPDNYTGYLSSLPDGTFVTRGQLVGYSGYSGNVSPPGIGGSHLHFSFRSGFDGTNLANTRAAVPEPMSGYYGFKHYGWTHDTDTPTNRTCPGFVTSPSYDASQAVVQKTLLGVEVALPAISNVGSDNNNPLHPVRWMETQVFNASNQRVVDRWDQITYSKTSGHFIPRQDSGHLGAIDLGTSWTSGIYYLKIRLHNTLRQQVTESNCGGIYTITNGGAILVPNDIVNRPAVALISGDINDDNVLDILDYNLLLAAYGTKQGDPKYNPAADLNDDGSVNGVDYNIWLRDSGAPPPCS